VRGWRPGLAALAIFLLCLCFADLEGGLLRSELGLSLAKALYQLPYLHHWPPGRDLGAGLLLILLLLALLFAAWSVLRFLFAQGGLQQVSGQALVMVAVLVLCSQWADLLPQLLPYGSAGRRYLASLALTLEEGLELAAAAFALLSLLTHPGSGGYLDPR